VVQSGKATLLELREKYSLEEMYNMWELNYTQKYNEWVAAERRRREAEMRRRWTVCHSV
jgi:hypothetical protein